jgi:nitrate/nitrite transporter NarK
MAFGAVLTAYGASDYYRAGGAGYGLMSSFLPSYSQELKMMLAGRFFYGLGAETSIVVVSKILVKWFKGKDLALAFGLKVGFGRLGTFLALRVSPSLAEEGAQLTTAIWFASILVCIGLLAFMIYILFDLKFDREIKQAKPTKTSDPFVVRDIFGILSKRAYIYILLLCVTFYSAVFPFLAFAPDFFLNKFGINTLESGKITSLLPLGTMVFTPLFGFFVDRKGRSATAMIIGAALFVVLAAIALKNGTGEAILFSTKPFYNPETFSTSVVLAGTALAVFSYIGFDGVSTLAEEVENPRINIGRATILVALFCALINITIAYFAQMVWPDYNALPQDVGAVLLIAERIGGEVFRYFVFLVMIVAGVSCALAGQTSAARLMYGMGRDGVLPRKFFSYVSKKRQIPS